MYSFNSYAQETIHVGTEPTFAPFGFVDDKTSEIVGFDIDVKGFKQRSISTPTNELVIKGPQEAFVENIRTNTSLLRRTINNENLIIESTTVGTITRTKCAICYINNLTNVDLVSEVKYRINNLSILLEIYN